MNAGKLRDLPIFVDSPMATKATEVFHSHSECFDAATAGLTVWTAVSAAWAADPGGAWLAAERVALIAALDGRRIVPGPAGSPARGRRDVLPTGRNMFAADAPIAHTDRD